MKKFTLFLSAMLFSLMSMAGALGDGYSKVIDITTLSAGDKVVLYCDDANVGVTGWDNNKDATVGANGWVEYVVENAENGVLLKDGETYIAQPTGNYFKYDAKGGVCTVTNGKLTSNGRILYQQGNYYRMYADKESDSNFKPFYVYEVTNEGGSSTPDDGGDDVTPDDGGDDVTPDDGGDDVNEQHC